ncbi:metallopeptidase family protein [Cumulibacter manganitolerans]|uniref:metallopeptidase family protein n=1 Tax=Cumulibacter manganitolerans TaxID=1884992 RepID=UPI001296A296|nr:metallopeptidase family protein [Cumulibacter manganitolerans]
MYRPHFPRARDRRGHGLRGPLFPSTVPVHRSRAELFDDLVLDIVEQLDPQWQRIMEQVELAVEDVPPVTHAHIDDVIHQPNVIEDSSVPLSRLIPGHVDGLGREHLPRIVVYRRPLEVRGKSPSDLQALVGDVIVEQLANLLGIDPDEIDPGR